MTVDPQIADIPRDLYYTIHNSTLALANAIAKLMETSLTKSPGTNFRSLLLRHNNKKISTTCTVVKYNAS